VVRRQRLPHSRGHQSNLKAVGLPLLHRAFERTTFAGWVKGGLKHA
jgi:hypothetical protein